MWIVVNVLALVEELANALLNVHRAVLSSTMGLAVDLPLLTTNP